MGDLFIGLVTHQRTAHPDSSGPIGLKQTLSDVLMGAGLQIQSRTEERNLLPATVSISESDLVDSRNMLKHVQRAWSRYRSESTIRAQLQRLGGALRGALRSNLEPASDVAAKRLLNIELAHLSLMESALESGSQFALIIEDDAQCADVIGLGHDLLALIQRDETPFMTQLSTSFSARELGISKLMREPLHTWLNGGIEYALHRPATNTVCAVLYRRDFLADVVPRWRAMDLMPVIPVDWRLNAMLINMHAGGSLPDGYASIVIPGPLVQRSLHG